MSFQFMTLTRIVAGDGVLDGIGVDAARLGRKVLIVTDPGVQQAGLVDVVARSLAAAGLEHTVFGDVEGNPTVENVAAGHEAQKGTAAEVVIAVGGGSAIDAAKAVALLATNGGRIHDYEGFEKLTSRPLPLLAVPTTVGTGSETTKGAVISDHAQHHKIIVVSDMMYPATGYLDPRMVTSLPASICAWTGIDALTHAIEGYVAKGANGFSDGLNIEAIRRIGRFLRPASKGDPEALHEMQIAAAMAGAGFHNAGLGLAHALANTIGGYFPTHHGATNGVLLPHVMQFNLPAALGRFGTIAAALGEDTRNLSDERAAQASVDAVAQLISDIGAPATLRALEVREDALAMIAEHAVDQLDRPANPRDNDAGDMADILRAAF